VTAAPPAASAGGLRRRLAVAFAGSLVLHAAAAAVLDVRGSGAQAKDAAAPSKAFALHASLRQPRPTQLAANEAPPAAAEPAPTRSLPPARAPVEQQQPRAHPLAAIPETSYYKRSELQVQPGIRTRTVPEYPQAALGSGLAGSVTLRLFVDQAGRVERVQTLSADLPAEFEQSAERAFRTALFTPGYRADRPVPVQIVIEVLFEEAPAGAK
jgi:TonB family protein